MSYSRYLAWLQQKGVQFPEGIYFSDEPIGTGTQLISVPKALVLHPETCRNQITTALSCKVPEELTSRDWILLYLVLHRVFQFHVSSRMATLLQHDAYVRILPESFGTPLEYFPAEVRLLEGTSLFNGTVQRLNSTAIAAQRAATWIKTTVGTTVSSPDTSQLLDIVQNETDWLKHWRWADNVYASRSFPASIAGWTAKPASYEPVLIPGLDSFNHRRGEPVTWEYRNDTTCLFSRSEIAPNAQIFNNYGAKSNEELLASYGFVQPSGPDDVLVLALRGGDSPKHYYWQQSQEDPPKELLEALQEQIPLTSDGDPRIAGLLQQARVIEALEQFIRMRRSHFVRTQLEVDDSISWMAEDGTDGVRAQVLDQIREYRQGQSRLLERGIQWTQTKLDQILDELEGLGFKLE